MAQPLSAPVPVPAPPPARFGRARRFLRRAVRALLLLLALLVLAAAGLGLWLRSQMRASLPQVAGERALPGLAAPVRVERDALGVPTIRGAGRLDVARATGFVHAQDRFFQMDLLRRQGAGELSELFGAVAVELDKEHRVHRFRTRARQVLARAGASERALLDAYAAGVNAGLASLGARPFEYVVLRAQPAPWRPEDSILAVAAMFFELHDEDGSGESDLGLMADLLPRPLFDFLAPPGTEWDAPLVGEPLAVPPVPGPEVADLRQAPPPAERTEQPSRRRFAALEAPAAREDAEAVALGSNNWAVAGAHSADGRALLANDMHLGLTVPNTWYRASLAWPAEPVEETAGERRITGVTLPGTPFVAVGSNGHVAWGFTNSYGDWTDLVVLEVDPRRPDHYRTPAGPRRFTRAIERIRVKGGEDVELEVRGTVWGPVLDQDHRGRPRALAWTAHLPGAIDMSAAGLEAARTIEEAMAAANRSGIPPQNFVAADETGRIGWTIMGRIPRRIGFDGRTPTSWADGSRRWAGLLPPEAAPRLLDPPAGRLWTANARTMDGAALALLGNGNYDLGARARQIRDGLLALDRATPRDMLAIQLDDRALFLERWRGLLLDTLTPEATGEHPRRRELRELVETTWTGRASVDSVAYRSVKAFRNNLLEQVFTVLTAPCWQADGRFAAGLTRQSEGPLWKLVAERPAHLLHSRFATWDEQLLAAVDATLDRLSEGGGPELAKRTWGERNTIRVQHPLGGALPFAGRWLNMPPRQLPGDGNMPRFQSPWEGASERIVVSPGQEGKGFFHMPVGQSGHPLSPHYRNGHRAWEEGEPTPFLPGPAVDTLTLVPARQGAG